MFGAPLWLFGLAALAIPLALHLWSRRPRDVIRVGSLRHLGDVAAARTWSTRLSEPLLLALRVGLLTALVLALAGPRLQAPRLGPAPARLVLVDPALLGDSLALREPLLDSLIRRHARVHLLAPGLPVRRLWDPRTSSYGGPDLPGPSDAQSLWDALVEADQLLAAGGTLEVVARPLLHRLGGRRPRISATVVWHRLPAAAGREWTVARWRTPEDSLRVVAARGDGALVRYALSTTGDAGDCHECAAVPERRIALQGVTEASRRRLALALRAVAGELGQAVALVPADSAELLVTTAALNDSLLRPGRALIHVDRVTLAGPALADTLLAAWPWPVLAADRGDPREASLGQATPDRGPRPPDPADSRRGRRFLLVLAAGLLLLERWFATRPPARAA